MAPSAAPAETPSVKGVASGFRSSAWRTTPAEASAAPTTAPASTRGMRATKKIWASTLSAKGIDRSNTRDRLIERAADERRQETRGDGESAVHRQRHREPRRIGRGLGADARERRLRNRHGVAPDRHDHQVSRRFVKADVGFDVVELPDGERAVEHIARGSLGKHAAGTHEDQRSHSDAARFRSCVASTIVTPVIPVQPGQERCHFELIREIERCRGFVEQQHVWRLRERTCDDDALLFSAAERHVWSRRKMRGTGGRQRFLRDCNVFGSLELEDAEIRVASHQRHLEHAVVECGMGLLRYERDVARQFAAGNAAQIVRPFNVIAPWSGCSTPAISRSRVVLPHPFGPRSPVSEPRWTATETSWSANAPAASRRAVVSE